MKQKREESNIERGERESEREREAEKDDSEEEETDLQGQNVSVMRRGGCFSTDSAEEKWLDTCWRRKTVLHLETGH